MNTHIHPFAYMVLLCCFLLTVRVDASADSRNWMAAIDDSKSLSELSIPGTHDAGALFEPIKGVAKCQNLSLAQQLHAGVRFLDIRCHNDGATFSIYHGIVFQQLTFTQVLKTVSEFLKANPSETVIMSIKEENSSSGRAFAALFDSYVAKDAAIWYLKPEIPSLGTVRGKIVLFRRFSSSGSGGIDASQWPDNTTFVTQNNQLNIEDYYHVPSSDVKWTAIIKHLDAAKTGSKSSLYITFASGYTSRSNGLPDITSVSDPVNKHLHRYFQSADKGRFGIILLDFADAALCEKIIATNSASKQ